MHQIEMILWVVTGANRFLHPDDGQRLCMMPFQLYLIHPFIVFHLSRLDSWRRQAKEGIPDVPLPNPAFQLFLVDPEAFPGQMGYLTPPPSSGTSPGSPLSCVCPINLSPILLQASSECLNFSLFL